MFEKIGLSVIHKSDLAFVETHLASLKVPFGAFEKEVLVEGASFTLGEIKRSFEEIVALGDDPELLHHLVAELTEYLQTHHSTSQAGQIAEKMINTYLTQLKGPVRDSVLDPIEGLLNSVPVDNKNLIDWLNRANHLFKVVEDEQNVLLKYMARFHLSLRDVNTGEIITTKVSLDMVATSFSHYLRECSLYAKANGQNIEAWKLGLLERQRTNPDILRMIIEKGANKLVFLTQLLTFAVAVTFVLVGIFADDIFDAASAKNQISELNARNGFLGQQIDDSSKEIRELRQELAQLKKNNR